MFIILVKQEHLCSLEKRPRLNVTFCLSQVVMLLYAPVLDRKVFFLQIFREKQTKKKITVINVHENCQFE